MAKIEVSKEKLEKLLELVKDCDDCPLEGRCNEMPGLTCYETLKNWVQNDTKMYHIGARVENYVEYTVEAPNIEEAIAQVRASLEDEYGGPNASYDILDFEEG